MKIVAALFATLFGRLLGQRKGALAAAVGIGVYTLLVGANAAVVRAALMGGLALFAPRGASRSRRLKPARCWSWEAAPGCTCWTSAGAGRC